MISIPILPLSIQVAEGTSGSGEQLVGRNTRCARRSRHIQPLRVRSFTLRTVGVHPISSALVLAGPRLDFLVKVVDPHPPVPVELTVVQPEYRLSRADVYIAPGVAPDGEVA